MIHSKAKISLVTSRSLIIDIVIIFGISLAANLKFVANVILNINQYQLLKNTNSVMNLCFYMYHTALKTLLI